MKATITIDNDFSLAVPVFVPDLDQVRAFVNQVHRSGKPWQGEIGGWAATYTPSSPMPPKGSKNPFTPATFGMGDGTVWGFFMMWDDGDNQPPTESVADWNLER